MLDEKQSDYGVSLDLLAELYTDMGNYPAALELRQKILARNIKLLGEGKWQTVNARTAVATVALLAKLDPDRRQQYLQCVNLDRDIAKFREAEKFSQAVAPRSRLWNTWKDLWPERS